MSFHFQFLNSLKLMFNLINLFIIIFLIIKIMLKKFFAQVLKYFTLSFKVFYHNLQYILLILNYQSKLKLYILLLLLI